MLPDHTDVLIIGAGPTGLALACALRQAGVDHLLVEERSQRANTSRAAVVHAHSLEALELIGVVETLSGQGRALARFTIRDRNRALLQIGFDDLPPPFRHILMVPQSTTERVMEDRLEQLGGRIDRGVTARDAAQDGDGALVRLTSPTQERTIRARFVVGADGMHSTVRRAANIPFQGTVYGASFVLADVRMDWPLGADEVSLFFSAAGLAVVAPLPDGAFRVVATLDDAPEQPQAEHVQKLLDARGPTFAPCRVKEVVWSSRFHVHHRLASEYRRGPFLLMGDAAHVHSPAGGQGMNTGLVDAKLLSEALTRVIRDGFPASLLHDYARLRRPAAERVMALTGRLTYLATIRSAPLRIARNLLFRLLDRSDSVKRAIALNLSGHSRRQFSSLPDSLSRASSQKPTSRAGTLQARPLGLAD